MSIQERMERWRTIGLVRLISKATNSRAIYDDTREFGFGWWFAYFLLLERSRKSLWQFAYLAAAIHRFNFVKSRKAVARALAVVLAALLYGLNSFFATAIKFLADAVAIWML